MCFTSESRPPLPPLAGAAVDFEDLRLVASDGGEFAAFSTRPNPASSVGVIVLPDVRGLYRYYEELALRLAERGFAAVAIDFYGRTGGASRRDDDFDVMAHTVLVSPEDVQRDVGAAAAYLHSPAGGGCEKIFTLGFCFGARHSWLAAAEGHQLSGAIGFYGQPGLRDRPPFMESSGRPGPTQRAGEMHAPILALFAGDDEMGITAHDVSAFDAALSRAGIEHEVVTYEGAPHSFFDRLYDEYAEQSANAWRRVLAFIERYGEQRPMA